MIGVVRLESSIHSGYGKAGIAPLANFAHPCRELLGPESIRLLQVCEQISLQMPASRLLDRAPLRRDGLLLRLPFAPGPGFDGAGQMRNLGTFGADLSFVGLGVGIHFSVGDLVIGEFQDFRSFACFGWIASPFSKIKEIL
jgi:hypothetical protein